MDNRSDLQQVKADIGQQGEDTAAELQEYRLLRESVKDYAIFMIDPIGIITRWGLGAEKMKHYTDEEALGKHFSMFYTDEDIEKGWPEHNLSEAVKNGRYEEVRIRMRKGKIPFWADVLITPLYNEENRVIGFSKIVKDITEQKEWEDRLKQSNRDLEQFATLAAHDLQAPLRKVESFAKDLRTLAEGKLGTQAMDTLARIQRSTRQMQNLVKDLLDMPRIFSEEHQFTLINLTDVLNQAVESLKPVIEESHANVEIGEMPSLEADFDQMHLLFHNLISNSLKFRHKEEAPDIKIFSEMIGQDKCQITVEDFGIGFQPEQAETIFDMFHRLLGQGTYPGAGIGLTVCEKIVEGHNGTITASAIPEEGATFVITLPIKQPR